MGNNYDFNSKKYIILLAVVLVLFLIFIIKAFDYLPEQISTDERSNASIVNNINSPASIKMSNNVEDDSQKTDIDSAEKNKHGHFDFMPKAENPEQESIDEVQAPQGINEEKVQSYNQEENNSGMSSGENALKCILNGNKFKANSDYSKALSEYQRVDELTNDNELRAMSYEGIAELYAKNRKFGTALAFANKALNASPNTARYMLVARIYYQAGDVDVAVSKLNNLLKQGF